MSGPGSVFHPCSPKWDEIREDIGHSRLCQNETKYEKILDTADFASREDCSFIMLNDAIRKPLLKAAKKTLRQPTMRAEFSLIHALISNWHTERIMRSYEELLLGGGGGGILIASEKLIKVYLLQPSRFRLNNKKKLWDEKKKHAPLQDSVRRYIREISTAMFLQIQYICLDLQKGTSKIF